VTAITLLASFVLGSQTAKAPQKIKIPYEKYTLSNGLKVILHVDKTLPVATINTWFYVGSKDEPERRSGFAHLFEHLMFMGTKRVPTGQFDSIMEAAGGFNNASTSEDRTNYYSYGPSNLLPTLLWLDADRLEDLAQEMTLKKLDLQREVVKNERRQNTENSPYGKAYEAINGLMYPKGHPYSTSVIGSHEDLTAATVEDVQSFFRTFYVPNNASLVVAGDFDPKVIKPMIAKLFGSLPRRDDVPRKIVQPFKYEGRSLTMVDDVASTKVFMAWHSPAYATAGNLEMRMATAILGEGPASRLNRTIVMEKGLATEISTYHLDQLHGSAFFVDSTLAPGKSAIELEKAIKKVIAEFAQTGPTTSEIKRVAASTEASIAKRLQKLDTRADLMNEFEFYFGEPDSFQMIIDRLRGMTPKVVASVLKSVSSKPSLVLRVIPKSTELETNPRDARPSIEPEKSFVTPKPIVNQNVKFWQRVSVPVTDVKVVFPFGIENDPVGKEGLVEFTAGLMAQGGNKLDSVEFAEKLEGLGGTIGAVSGIRQTVFSLSSPTSQFNLSASLFRSVLDAPTLSQSDFAQAKAMMISSIEDDDKNPSALALKVANEKFFGPKSPFGKSATKKSVSSFTLEDVRAMSKKLRAQKAEILIASGAPYSTLKGAVDSQIRSALKGTNWSSLKISNQSLNQTARLLIVDRPKAVQTSILGCFPALVTSSENLLALKLSGIILGGSFTSRLNANLREDKGYTYGASARVSDDPSYGMVSINASVRADVTGASMKEFLKELKRIQDQDISEEEAQKSRKIFRTNEIEGFVTLESILDSQVEVASKGLTFSSIDQNLRQMNGIKALDLNAISKKVLSTDKCLWVLVGDKDEILKQISGLGLPTPEIVKL
jgi:zinc protease